MLLSYNERKFLATCRELYLSGNYEYEDFEDNRYIAPNSVKTLLFIEEIGIDDTDKICDYVFEDIFRYVYDVSENRDKYISDYVGEMLTYDNVLKKMVYIKCAICQNLLYIIIHESI